MNNKDKELTKKELTALCRKQEEYIKELEEKLKSPSDTEKCCEPSKPDYKELCRQIDNLNYKLSELIDENNALRRSLTIAHKEMNHWKNSSDMFEGYYYKEHNRVEKLFNELEQLTREEVKKCQETITKD